MGRRTIAEREAIRARRLAYSMANYWVLREKRQYYYQQHRNYICARSDYRRGIGCRYGATYPRLRKKKGGGKFVLTLSPCSTRITLDSVADAEELLELYRRFRRCAISVAPFFVLPPAIVPQGCAWALCSVQSDANTKTAVRSALVEALALLYEREGKVEEHPHINKEAGYLLLLMDEYEALPD